MVIKSVLGVFVFVLSLTITVQASMCASYLASSIAQPVFSSDLSEKAFWTAFLGHNEYSTAEFKQRGYSTYVASDKFRYDCVDCRVYWPAVGRHDDQAKSF